MKSYDFLEPAQLELEEEVRYFNDREEGLGYEFAKEVANTISRIVKTLPIRHLRTTGVRDRNSGTGTLARSRATTPGSAQGPLELAKARSRMNASA